MICIGFAKSLLSLAFRKPCGRDIKFVFNEESYLVKNCVSGSVYRSLILCRMVEGMLISAKPELLSSAHVCIIRCNERSLGILMQFNAMDKMTDWLVSNIQRFKSW